MQHYGAAKARLFAEPPVTRQVLNIDDPFGGALAARVPAGTQLVCTTRRSAAPPAAAHQLLRGERVIASETGLQLHLAGSFGNATLRSPLLGDFNADNLLTVLGVLLAL